MGPCDGEHERAVLLARSANRQVGAAKQAMPPHRRWSATRRGGRRALRSPHGTLRVWPNRLAPLTVALVAAVTAPACTPPTGGLVDYAVVEGFRVSPTFNAFTEPCAIRYTLQEPATVEVRVVRVQPDGARALVHQVSGPTRETAGPRTAAWRGTGPNGLFAPQGEYVVELYATLDGTDRAESWELTTLMYRT